MRSLRQVRGVTGVCVVLSSIVNLRRVNRSSLSSPEAAWREGGGGKEGGKERGREGSLRLGCKEVEFREMKVGRSMYSEIGRWKEGRWLREKEREEGGKEKVEER